jgi:hypothetical protein
MSLKLSLLFAAVLALGISAAPAFAHHGWGGNVDEVSSLTGVVVNGVSLAGPHATMKIKVDNTVWDLTLAPPPATQRAGLKEGMIPVGATVTVRGNRNKDPKKFEMKVVQVTYNGKSFDVYPDRT